MIIFNPNSIIYTFVSILQNIDLNVIQKSKVKRCYPLILYILNESKLRKCLYIKCQI